MAPPAISTAVPGELVVWGDNTKRQISDAPKGLFTKVAPGGATQSLAIKADGTLWLWGGVGAGTPTMPIVPILTTTPGDKYIDVAIGPSFAVAIRASDRWIQTWGVFASGVPNNPALPTKLAGTRFFAVTVGGAFGLAIVEHDRTLVQWGAGAGTEPRPRGVRFIEVRARNDYCLALDEFGGLWGWGGTLFVPPPTGKVKHPTFTERHLRGWKFEGGHYFHKGPFKAIAAGSLQKNLPKILPHILALKRNGTVMGWGADTFGAITKAPKSVNFTAIAAGHAFSIGLDNKGMLHHWGDPMQISAGAAAGTAKGILETLPTGPFVSIGAATTHATALRPSGDYLTAPNR